MALRSLEALQHPTPIIGGVPFDDLHAIPGSMGQSG
jgi:hypothetical protein